MEKCFHFNTLYFFFKSYYYFFNCWQVLLQLLVLLQGITLVKDELWSLVALNPSQAMTSRNLGMVHMMILTMTMKMKTKMMTSRNLGMVYMMIMTMTMVTKSITNRIHSRQGAALVCLMEVGLSAPNDHQDGHDENDHDDHDNDDDHMMIIRLLMIMIMMTMMMTMIMMIIAIMIRIPESRRQHKECSRRR